MSYALIANAGTNASSSSTVTTAAIDTSGANLIVIAVTYLTGATPTDNKSNTWTALTANGASAVNSTRLFYCQAPTVGSGHTFTHAVGSAFASIYVAAFSGSVATPFDKESGGGGTTVATVAPGSITPAEDNELVVVAMGYDGTQTITAPAGYTITDQFPLNGGVAYGGALAYKIQTTATATNPAYTWTGNQNAQAVIAAFKAGASAGGATTGILLVGNMRGTLGNLSGGLMQ